MKKYILPLIISLLIVAAPVVAMEVWEYGEFSKRAEIAASCGIVKSISDYTGSYEQNMRIKDCQTMVPVNPWTQEEIASEELFGGMRPSSFKTTLAESLTSSASTTEEITVSSVATKDGQTLTTSDVGDFICLKISPGSSNEEIVCCSGGITSTTFNDCTRGYSFKSNAAYTGNAKSHSPGETVIISNDDQYLSEQYTANNDTETITGVWTYAGGDGGVIKFYMGDSNTYFWMSTTTGNIGFATSSSGELTWNTNGTTFLSVPPLILSSGELKIGTTTNNYDFDLSSGFLSIRKSATVTSTAHGLEVVTTTPYNFTSGFQIGGVQLDGLSSRASSTALNNLVNGSSTQADYFHSHNRLYAYYDKNTSSTVSGTTEGTLISVTIPGGAMDINGTLRAKARGVVKDGNGSWMIFKFGGKTIATSTRMQEISGGTLNWQAEIEISNRGDTGSQYATLSFLSRGHHLSCEDSQASSTVFSIDTDSDQTFEIRGDNANANGSVVIGAIDIQLIR